MRANIARDLIVLSDGTGNSASKASKTNVWRLYQAIDLTDGSQVAVFGDGVGTSSVTVLRVLGLALGIGVKRNVLNLYKFLCFNYQPDDRIWAFGFSRGAYTVRVLAGLICKEDLVTWNSEEELNRNGLAAYRAFRKSEFDTSWWRFWVKGGRNLRDGLVRAWNWITHLRGKDSPYSFHRRLGHRERLCLPVEELTIAVDKLVWPMRFTDTSLLPNVEHARQALSLDDERRRFLPVPWDESKTINRDRLLQVWFPGAHADVGGGYPDDGLSFVPLCWMIDEAKKQGLRFMSCIVEDFKALAVPTGRIYDSRSDFGALWRYQPRNVDERMNPDEAPTPKADHIRPIVHASVITRMIKGTDGYAPISLPEKFDVQPPYGDKVPFEIAAVTKALADAPAVIQALADAPAVIQALANATANATPRRGPLSDAHTRARALDEQHQFLIDMQKVVTAARASESDRTAFFKLVLYTVWWRRVVYYIPQSVFAVADKEAQPLTLDGSREGLTQFFATQRRTLLVARSGTGKSVFLCAARGGSTLPRAASVFRRLCSLISARMLSGRKVQDLVRDALRGAGVELADGDLDFLISKGGFLILVDTLNELPDPADAQERSGMQEFGGTQALG
jgi:hypothetical protein